MYLLSMTDEAKQTPITRMRKLLGISETADDHASVANLTAEQVAVLMGYPAKRADGTLIPEPPEAARKIFLDVLEESRNPRLLEKFRKTPSEPLSIDAAATLAEVKEALGLNRSDHRLPYEHVEKPQDSLINESKMIEKDLKILDHEHLHFQGPVDEPLGRLLTKEEMRGFVETGELPNRPDVNRIAGRPRETGLFEEPFADRVTYIPPADAVPQTPDVPKMPTALKSSPGGLGL